MKILSIFLLGLCGICAAASAVSVVVGNSKAVVTFFALSFVFIGAHRICQQGLKLQRQLDLMQEKNRSELLQMPGR